MALTINLLEYLEAAARRHPDKVAFYDEGGSLTFSEMLTLSRSVGTFLMEHTTGKNKPIPVLAERNADTILAFLAVLQSGNCYVPIDPDMPTERKREIMRQLTPEVIIAAGDKPCDALGAPVYAIRDCLCEADDKALNDRRRSIIDLDPAYIIFTSGSTGTPKGIVVSHRSVIDFAEWMAETCHFTEDDILGNQAPFYFDLSVKDVWLTFKCCCTTYILPKKLFMFPKLLIAALNEHKVTHLNWATSAFNLVANSGILARTAPETVKKVVLGGETLYAKNLNRWREAIPDCTFINLYGPTEVTVDCTCYEVTRDFTDDEVVPIGRACRNMEVLLLDDSLNPVADGAVGEICVRGTGIARGYYADAEKTAKAFVQNPACPHYPDILYRTGDLGYKNADGDIVFATRADGQVKHMGYRIELGEVERAVNSAPGVTAAVCFYDGGRGKIVCSYAGTADGKAITDHIKLSLPRYMFPNLYRRRDTMPMTPNGKIDRVTIRKEYDDEA